MTVETEVAALTTAVNSLTSTVNVSKATLDAAAAEAVDAYDSFDDRYLGVKNSAPANDNDGGALLTGALYFNSTSNTMFVFTGSAWAAVANNNIINPNVALTQDLATNGNDVKFGDNDKATFGAGDDLQIYHDGSHSQIKDAGTGNLYIKATSGVLIQDNDTGTNRITTSAAGPVYVYHAGDQKLATTSTGIDVTGTATMDGLTASNTTQNDALGIAQVVNTTADDVSSSTMTVKNHSGTGQFMEWRTFGMRIGSRIITNNGVGDVAFTHGNDVEKMRLTATGLGIGTSSPSALADIYDSASSSSNDLLHVRDYLGGGADKTRLIVKNGGNVGIGTSSPSSLLHASGVGATFTLQDTRGIGNTHTLRSSGTNGESLQLDSAQDFYLNADTQIFRSASEVERMRIDSSGNVGIGLAGKTSSTILKIENASGYAPTLVLNQSGIGAASIAVPASENALQFNYFNGSSLTESMRIDGSGNLLVGTSSTNPTSGFRFLPSAGNSYAEISHDVGSPSGTSFAIFRYNQGVIGSIGQNGTSQVLYNTSSDERLKENITDADDAGSKIDAIQVRKFDWKADGSHQDYGMIAQELQAVAPEAVSGDSNSEDMMGVDYSKLVPMLIKEIQSLRNRVAQLEG